MGYSFDGTNKIVTLTAGTTEVDVRDLYSRWKEWVLNDEGCRFVNGMSPVGGEPINETEGIYVTTYIFLVDSWRVRPQEADHTLTITEGVLLTDTGDDPFITTLGAYNVQIKYNQPIRTETVFIETEGGSGGLTDEEHDQLMERVLTTGKFLALK